MISRRSFTLAAAASAILPGLSRPSLARPMPGEGWRRFQVTTRLDLADTAGGAQAWIPLGAFDDVDWIRSEGNGWVVSPGAEATRRVSNGAAMLHVRWLGGSGFAEVTSSFVTRDRVAAFGQPRSHAVLSQADRDLHLRGSAEAPVTSGIIKETADRITAGRTGELEKAQAIYDWVVDNTFRSAPVRGCGDGDVARMLSSGVLGGKCADINPLFVALARASGLPARDLYGIRVAPSRLGLRSLGPSTAAITKAQHCRAEVFLDGLGWTAMDPADVRKIMLEEAPGGLTLDDARVRQARGRLFGSWDGNWVPFNNAHDLVLPGSRTGARVNFLMYPQVETASGMLDCYDPERIRYAITAKELAI